jgi:hypothetical protein
VTKKCKNRSSAVKDKLSEKEDFDLLSLTFPCPQVLHLFSSLDLSLHHVKYVPAGQFTQREQDPSYCPLGQHIVAASFDHVLVGQSLHALFCVRYLPALQVCGAAVIYVINI